MPEPTVEQRRLWFDEIDCSLRRPEHGLTIASSKAAGRYVDFCSREEQNQIISGWTHALCDSESPLVPARRNGLTRALGLCFHCQDISSTWSALEMQMLTILRDQTCSSDSIELRCASLTALADGALICTPSGGPRGNTPC